MPRVVHLISSSLHSGLNYTLLPCSRGRNAGSSIVVFVATSSTSGLDGGLMRGREATLTQTACSLKRSKAEVMTFLVRNPRLRERSLSESHMRGACLTSLLW